jgi:endo-1,4-beta-xylanase
VHEWFHTAHSKKYLSYINDFGILSDNNTEHRENYHQWIDYIVKNNAPLDGIGFQGHFIAPMPPEEILARIDSYGKYGKKMQITEFDFDYPDADLQAKFFEDFLILVYSHPLMSAHINWIFLEDNFRPNGALYRRDFTPTSMGKIWEKLLTQTWHTETSQTTDATGDISLRGFKGTYTVEVEYEGKRQPFTIHLDHNQNENLTFSPTP